MNLVVSCHFGEEGVSFNILYFLFFLPDILLPQGQLFVITEGQPHSPDINLQFSCLSCYRKEKRNFNFQYESLLGQMGYCVPGLHPKHCNRLSRV